MKQTRWASLVESLGNVLVGAWISLISQILVFPIFGLHVPLRDNVIMVGIFTGISIARSFILRRLFEFLRVGGMLP
jgi:hypothetical protein